MPRNCQRCCTQPPDYVCSAPECCMLWRGPVPVLVPGRFSDTISRCRPLEEAKTSGPCKNLNAIPTVACAGLKISEGEYRRLDYWTFSPCFVSATLKGTMCPAQNSTNDIWIRNPLGENYYNPLVFHPKPRGYVNYNAMWDIQAPPSC